MSDFFVEFESADDARLGQLVAVVEALCRAKQTDEWRDDDYWLGFFDEEARSHLWWPTSKELKEWERRWLSTPVVLEAHQLGAGVGALLEPVGQDEPRRPG